VNQGERERKRETIVMTITVAQGSSRGVAGQRGRKESGPHTGTLKGIL
jgi:hypothetical protein